MSVACRLTLAFVCLSCAQAGSAAGLTIPAARLDRAAILLGERVSVSIGISDPSLAGLKTRPVANLENADTALRQMLAGTTAQAIRVGRRAWRIVRRPTMPYPRRRPSVQAPDAELSSGSNEDILVIASKRDVPLSRYPASVSLLSTNLLAPGLEAGGSETLALYVPSLTSTHLGPGRNKLFVRGLADSSFNGPTQATVGAYLGEARLSYNGPDPDLRLYDMRSVELLEGPQGTLHGVGTLGGVILLQPTPPNLERVEASFSAGLSLTRHGEPGSDISAVVDLPLNDAIGLRAVGYHVLDGGYIDDRFRGLTDVNEIETTGGRVSLRLAPGPGWTIDLGGVLQRIRGEDSQYSDRQSPPLTKSSPIAEAFSSQYGLGQLVVRKSWDALTLTSATSFARQSIRETFDATTPGEPTRFDQHARVSFFSNENRLMQQEPDGTGWVIGTSLADNRYSLQRGFAPVAALRSLGGISNRIREATVFGDATIPLGNRWQVSAGGRLTVLELSGATVGTTGFALMREARTQASRRQAALLPSLSVTWRPGSDLLAYGRYQQSFRPGGIVVRDAFVQRYRSDDVQSVEVGVRWEAPDLKLRLTSALSYTSWRNIQADQIDGGGLPTTINIGNGRIVTLDVKGTLRPAPGWSIDLGGVFADSRLVNPLPTIIGVIRSDLPNVARANGSVAVRYGTVIGAVDLSLSAWARYVGRSRLGVGPILGKRQGQYVDSGLSMRATRGRYALSATLTNLNDAIGNRFALGSPLLLGSEEQVTPLRPRTLRIGVETAL
jgi:outer membrane receptor protein involved in Fe transport